MTADANTGSGQNFSVTRAQGANRYRCPPCRIHWLVRLGGGSLLESSSQKFFGPWIIASCFVTLGLSTGFPYHNIAFFFCRDNRSPRRRSWLQKT